MRRASLYFMLLGFLVFGGLGYAVGSNHLLTPAYADAADSCQQFPQTGHQVCGAFLQYWTANGGLAQQGYPISDPFMEMSATDGKTYQVQYFERAVFELHPELPAGSNVLLSLLGSEKYKAKYAAGTPAATTMTVMITPMATGTAAATPTRPATMAPTSSPTSAPTVATPTTAVSMGPSDLTAYAQYLKGKFGSYGGHAIGITDVHITELDDGGYAAGFEVTNDEALYIFNMAHKSDLQAWGAALLTELKAHFPNVYVAGDLEENYYTFNPGTETDCHYVDLEDFDSDRGWFVSSTFVHAVYSPPTPGIAHASSDNVKVCYAK